MKFSILLRRIVWGVSALVTTNLLSVSLISISPLTKFIPNFTIANAEDISSSCDKYIKQAKVIVYETEEAVAASKSQLQESESKATKFQMLVKEGAISRNQVSKVLKEVENAKKDLEGAIAKQQEAKEQLATLEKLTSCFIAP